MKATQEHRRGHEPARTRPAGRDRLALLAGATPAPERFEHRLGPAQVAHAAAYLAALDQEQSVAGHAGLQRASRVAHAVDVVEPGDEQTALDLADQRCGAARPPGHDEMGRARAVGLV